jgi:hypothetical protein
LFKSFKAVTRAVFTCGFPTRKKLLSFFLFSFSFFLTRGLKPALHLVRYKHLPTATIGKLEVVVDGHSETFATLELPYDDNRSNHSCIPCGTYKLNFEFSNKFVRNLWELKGVPDRAEIKIHAGNTPKDTNGCILVGTTASTYLGNPALINSRKALSDLHWLLSRYKEATLEISNAA